MKNRRALDRHTAEWTRQEKRVPESRLNELADRSGAELKLTAETSVFRAKVLVTNVLHQKRTVSVWHRQRVLPYVEAIPTMFAWVPVQRNIMVDDEPVLRNIPYVGDDDAKADDEFVHELVENYEGRVHGGIGGYMNDVILVELVQSLLRYHKQQHPQTGLTDQSVGNGNTKHVSPNTSANSADMVVFEKIAECFPDKGNAYEIKEKYRILTFGMLSTS